eukprot:COSAG01_NODE_26851_length_701_cov_1.367110_1_plen_220_part_10
MTYNLAQLRKAITQRRQAEGFSQPSSAMLSAHLNKHAFMFGELNIDPNALRNLKQKRAAWTAIKSRFHPLVGQLNTRDAHGYIHATNKHVGYAYPADMLQQASSLVGGRKSQEQCTDAGRALSKDRSSKGAIELNECRWHRDSESDEEPEPDPEPEVPNKPKSKKPTPQAKKLPTAQEDKFYRTLVKSQSAQAYHTFYKYVKDVHGWPQSQINDFWAHLK